MGDVICGFCKGQATAGCEHCNPTEYYFSHQTELESLRQQVQDLKAENERLRNFRSAVCGWRERDWPAWFCRKTAEAIADFGRELEPCPPTAPNWIETKQAIKPTHEAADAFWKYWRENGETHVHGYYESTWGAINAALNSTGQIAAADRIRNLEALIAPAREAAQYLEKPFYLMVRRMELAANLNAALEKCDG